MPFRKAYVHARLLPPRPAQDMVPRNAAPLRLASTDKGIRPLPHVLPIIITAVKEGECIVAMRNAVVQVMSPCAAQVAVTHAVSRIDAGLFDYAYVVAFYLPLADSDRNLHVSFFNFVKVDTYIKLLPVALF